LGCIIDTGTFVASAPLRELHRKFGFELATAKELLAGRGSDIEHSEHTLSTPNMKEERTIIMPTSHCALEPEEALPERFRAIDLTRYRSSIGTCTCANGAVAHVSMSGSAR
jgi:hypothetical protein